MSTTSESRPAIPSTRISDVTLRETTERLEDAHSNASAALVELSSLYGRNRQPDSYTLEVLIGRVGEAAQAVRSVLDDFSPGALDDESDVLSDETQEALAQLSPADGENGRRRDRERELEVYATRLHGRVRDLESQLHTLRTLPKTMVNMLEAWEAEAPTIGDEPEGLHLLGELDRRAVDDADEGGSWFVECSCGWRSQPTTFAEEAEALGEAHVRRLTL